MSDDALSVLKLVEMLGPEPVFRLVEARGGLRTHVPKEPNQGSQLSLIIGLPAAKILADAMGGDALKVPLARTWRTAIYRRRGQTGREIARRLGVMENTVWEYLNKPLPGVLREAVDALAGDGAVY